MIDLPAKASRTNAIGALRLFFAVFVIYSHSYFLGGFGPEPLWILTDSRVFLGGLGVQGFFVLSGWLVTLSYQRSTSCGRFLWHRMLRLAPALWTCLAVTAFAFAPLAFLKGGESPDSFFSLEPGPLTYLVSNLLLPRSQISIGDLLASNPWPADWNGSLWTLFYEGSCYLMVACFGLCGLLQPRRVPGLLLLIGPILLYIVWTAAPSYLPKVVGRLFDTPGKVLCVYFLSGMVWALLPEKALARLSQTWVACAAAAYLVAGYAWQFHNVSTPIVLAPILFWFANHLPLMGVEERVGGDYSYGLYIYGYPVQQLLANLGIHKEGLLVYGTASLVLALLLAILSWRLIEKPALSLKNVLRPFG